MLGAQLLTCRTGILNSSPTSARNDIFLVSHLYYFSSDEHQNKCIPSHLEKYRREIASYTKLHTSLRGSSLISNPALPLSLINSGFCFTVVFITLLSHFSREFARSRKGKFGNNILGRRKINLRTSQLLCSRFPMRAPSLNLCPN